jgi:hypothetical protein
MAGEFFSQKPAFTPQTGHVQRVLGVLIFEWNIEPAFRTDWSVLIQVKLTFIAQRIEYNKCDDDSQRNEDYQKDEHSV